MESFYLEEAIRVTGLPEKVVRDAFRQWPELEEKKKYVKFISYRGIVVEGSERYLSFSYCVREAIVTKNEELINYFLGLGILKIPRGSRPDIWDYLPIQILVRNYVEKIPRIYQLLEDWKNLNWDFARMWALLLENVKTQYLESIPVKSNEDILETVLTVKFIEQIPRDEKKSESIAYFLCFLNKETFERIYLEEQHSYKIVLDLAIGTNDVNLFKKAMEKDQKEMKNILRKFYFSFANDPIDILKAIYSYVGLGRASELTKHFIEDHALKCTRFMLEKIGDKVTLENLLIDSIRYSNFPIFLQLTGKRKLPVIYISDHLEYCYSPGIWRYFLSQYPDAKFPEMPELVKFFLAE